MCRDIMRATDKAIARQSAAQAQSSAHGTATQGTRGDALTIEPPPIIWWHQIDSEEDEGHQAQDVASWVVTRDLVRARTQLMHSRGADGTASLEKLKMDFVLFARDTYLV